MTKREDITSSRDVASRGLMYPQSLPVEDKLLLCRAVLALTEPSAPEEMEYSIVYNHLNNPFRSVIFNTRPKSSATGACIEQRRKAIPAGPWEPVKEKM